MDFYFREEPELDKPVLTSDGGSDVSAGAERARLWGWNRCACHCLNIALQAALKEEVVHECLELFDGIGGQILQEPESMEHVQEAPNGNTRSGGGAQR